MYLPLPAALQDSARRSTMGYVFLYVMGIVLVHASAGWFVVGVGRNGSEYSVLLIVCLLCVGLQHVTARTSSSTGR